MGGFASIPLSFQNPQFQNPAQMQQQQLQTRNLMQQGQMNGLQQSLAQQQIQEGQLRLGAQQAINDAYKQSYSTGADGTPVFDMQGMAKRLSQAGWGSQVPGMMAGQLKMQTEEAELAKVRAGNVAQQATQIAQGLQGITDDNGYQTLLPQLRQAAQAQGSDPSQVMQHYDPKDPASQATLKQYIARGTSLADYAGQQQHAADMAQRLAENRAKNIEEYQRQINADVANARNQGQLDDVRNKWIALGAPDNQTALIPKTWTSDVPTQAAKSVIPLEKQPEFQAKGFTAAAQRMGAAAGQSQQAYAAEYRNLDPQVQGMFPTPDSWTPANTPGGGTRQAALEAGMTPKDFITAQNTEAYRKNTEAYRQNRLQQFDRALDLKEGDGTGGGQTANSRAVDKRADSKSYKDLIDKEDATKFYRNKLGNALTSTSGYFVDDKGNQIDPASPPSKMSGIGKMTPAEQRQDMMQRYDATTQQLGRIGSQKNDILTRAGTPPAMSTDQYQGWLDSTSAKVHGATAPAVTPPVTPPAAGVTKPTAPAAAPPSAPPAAPPGGIKPTAATPAKPAVPPAKSPYSIGQSVMYQGKPHKITAIDPKTGKLSIEP